MAGAWGWARVVVFLEVCDLVEQHLRAELSSLQTGSAQSREEIALTPSGRCWSVVAGFSSSCY